ncbi:putative Zn-dependent hydrolase [Podospora australis]|uniref:Zn-dependent hydrolase n=1 Tax=Podospora australis TaxID=1536484 RepID=A0AAN6WXX4_9PEZI|nr:putative Zn-dependent hydrolase [Podospora australis]
MSNPPSPIVHTIFEPVTGTWQYIVADPSSLKAVIIDPVLDFDPCRNAIATSTADSLLAVVKENGYTVTHLLETHAHADHLTAARYLQTQLPGTPEICIGKRIVEVQERFAKKYGISEEEYTGVFDNLWEDDETFAIGELEGRVVRLPGHTPDHVGYLIGENIFCGDSLFDPDVGSARCDFPGGDAHQLFSSVSTLFSLPDHYKIYTGHDYPPTGIRTEPVPFTTVGEQKARNKHLKTGTSKEEFVAWRTERDSALAEPRLLHQALQVNIRGGRLPAPSTEGDSFLVVPVRIPGGVKL